MNLGDNLLFTEKYRPDNIKDCILPDRIKNIFLGYVKNPGSLTSIILSGISGVGKTTVARALAKELGVDILFINASNERGLEVIRNQISQFAGTVSMLGPENSRKMVVLDEADGLTKLSQEALKGVFEEFAENAIFILTCNFKNKLIDALHSRCTVIDFKLAKEDKQSMAVQFMARLKYILKQESIEYEASVLAQLIKKYMPDWRKVLNELQKFSSSGKLSSDVLVNLSGESFSELIDFMKNKNYTRVRKWVTDNNDVDPATLFRMFYDHASKNMDSSSIPLLVVTLAKYQYQAAFVADQEVNTSACLAEIMVDCNFQ